MINSYRWMPRILFLAAVTMMTVACAASGPNVADQPIAIAVWDLEDLSPVTRAQAGMGELLAGQIAARLGEIQNFQVVERQNLLKAMEELNIGSSQLADDQTRLKLGRIIGARQMVFGAFQSAGGALRLDLRRVDVASGKILKTATGMSAGSDVSGWLQAADQAAAELVK